PVDETEELALFLLELSLLELGLRRGELGHVIEVPDLVQIPAHEALLQELDAARDLRRRRIQPPRLEEELERLLVATLGEELLELGARAVRRRHRRIALLESDAGLAQIVARARIVGLHVDRLGPYSDRVIDEPRVIEVEPFLEEAVDAARRHRSYG